jgi:hypothetical protein
VEQWVQQAVTYEEQWLDLRLAEAITDIAAPALIWTPLYSTAKG